MSWVIHPETGYAVKVGSTEYHKIRNAHRLKVYRVKPTRRQPVGRHTGDEYAIGALQDFLDYSFLDRAYDRSSTAAVQKETELISKDRVVLYQNAIANAWKLWLVQVFKCKQFKPNEMRAVFFFQTLIFDLIPNFFYDFHMTKQALDNLDKMVKWCTTKGGIARFTKDGAGTSNSYAWASVENKVTKASRNLVIKAGEGFCPNEFRPLLQKIIGQGNIREEDYIEYKNVLVQLVRPTRYLMTQVAIKMASVKWTSKYPRRLWMGKRKLKGATPAPGFSLGGYTNWMYNVEDAIASATGRYGLDNESKPNFDSKYKVVIIQFDVVTPPIYILATELMSVGPRESEIVVLHPDGYDLQCIARSKQQRNITRGGAFFWKDSSVQPTPKTPVCIDYEIWCYTCKKSDIIASAKAEDEPELVLEGVLKERQTEVKQLSRQAEAIRLRIEQGRDIKTLKAFEEAEQLKLVELEAKQKLADELVKQEQTVLQQKADSDAVARMAKRELAIRESQIAEDKERTRRLDATQRQYLGQERFLVRKREAEQTRKILQSQVPVVDKSKPGKTVELIAEKYDQAGKLGDFSFDTRQPENARALFILWEDTDDTDDIVSTSHIINADHKDWESGYPIRAVGVPVVSSTKIFTDPASNEAELKALVRAFTKLQSLLERGLYDRVIYSVLANGRLNTHPFLINIKAENYITKKLKEITDANKYYPLDYLKTRVASQADLDRARYGLPSSISDLAKKYGIALTSESDITDKDLGIPGPIYPKAQIQWKKVSTTERPVFWTKAQLDAPETQGILTIYFDSVQDYDLKTPGYATAIIRPESFVTPPLSMPIITYVRPYFVDKRAYDEAQLGFEYKRVRGKFSGMFGGLNRAIPASEVRNGGKTAKGFIQMGIANLKTLLDKQWYKFVIIPDKIENLFGDEPDDEVAEDISIYLYAEVKRVIDAHNLLMKSYHARTYASRQPRPRVKRSFWS